jgi:hypothetical protein
VQQQTFGGGPDTGRGQAAHASCAKCEVYVGDLTRYELLQQPGEAAHKDWSLAAAHYAAAARLFPPSGMAHNQLAVLATYGQDETTAAYQYCRALLCAAPFPTARANLMLLLDKHRAGGGGAHTGDGSAVCAATLAAHVALAGRLPAATEAATEAVRCLNDALASSEGAATLLAWGPTCDHPPQGLHLLCSALGAVSSAAWAAPDADDAPHTVAATMAAARVLLYGTAAAFLRAAGAQAFRPMVRGVAMGVALPFLEWAAVSPADSMATPPGEPVHEAEAAQRSACWAAAAALMNALQDAGVTAITPSQPVVATAPAAGRRGSSLPGDACPALAEDYELRGFSPLQQCHSALRFSGHGAFTAATQAAITGEPDAVRDSRARRALTAGVKLASAGGGTWMSPLIQSPATGRFALRHADKHKLQDAQAGGERVVWRQPPKAAVQPGAQDMPASGEAPTLQPVPRTWPAPPDVSTLPLPFPGLLAAARAGTSAVEMPPSHGLLRTSNPFIVK